MKFLIPLILACVIIMSCDDSNNSTGPQLSRFEQFVLDTMLIDQFIAENNIQNSQIEENGIRYVIHEEGMGDNPIPSDQIRINFEGRILGGEKDGDIFDSGLLKNFIIEEIRLVGMQFGIPLIKEGGSITLYIPSFFAFGGFGDGKDVPPFSNVIIDIDLVQIVK